MPLIIQRDRVLSVYAEAARRGWVVPTFCVENLTTMEAVLDATREHAELLGCPGIPVTIALTNLYSHRSQTLNYTHTRRWDMGLKLFMADLEVLTSSGSPYENLNVMSHLDHVQHDLDEELLSWDMNQFSSIMFDASSLPFERNMELTGRFMEQHGDKIVVEGACDEIVDATGSEVSQLTTPERAEEYVRKTGVDFIVANLGTEHRASAAELKYHGDLARRIQNRVGAMLVLHGCSSVSNDQIRSLFSDGVCKVNIWTALERDSSPALLADMVRNAAKVCGSEAASKLYKEGLLGPEADIRSSAHLGFFTTTYRQEVVFEQMKAVISNYLKLWYT